MPDRLQIKGLRDGLLVTLGEGSWLEVREALFDHIQKQSEFFKGARLALDVGNNILHAAELGQLRDALSEKEISLWAVMSSSPMTEKTAQTLGLATRLTKPRPERIYDLADTQIQGGEPAILIRRTLRSGFSIKSPGHVIIIGDVNPGAEIIAGGDVIVWGRLRGVVHAGAQGNESSIICAIDLSPTQLRIAGQIVITPQRKGKSQPEMAHLKDGHVIAEAWNLK